MSDLFPEWGKDDFFLPNVSASHASNVYRGEEQIRRQMQQERERVKSADADDVRRAQADALAQQYSQTDFDLIEPVDEFMERTVYDPLTVNPVTLDYTRGRRLVLEPFQKRILRHIFTPHGDSVSKYVTVIWSQPKKSGKTQIAAGVVAWFAEYIDPPNNILVVANKKDQAKGRIYKSALPTLKSLGADVPTARTAVPEVRMTNGTTIKAIPNNPASEAGDFYCLTAWSEIWGFKAESDERLFAELVPVETVRVSMQWIETYVGYLDESKTLLRIFNDFMTQDSEWKDLAPGAQYVPELADITTSNGRPCCIEHPDKQAFLFWDHDRRMPWQTERAKRRDMSKLPKTEGIRLYENRWQSSSSELLEEYWILRSCNADKEILVNSYITERFVLAIDAAMRHDSISLIGTHKLDEMYVTSFCEIHDPKGQDADLYALVEQRVKELFDAGRLLSYQDEDGEWITPVYVDPYQLHQIRLNLIDYGLTVIEFQQGSQRNLSDTMLYNLYKDDLIANPNDPMLLEHLRGGKGKYFENEIIRIIKGTTKDAKRIDALVAQSMSCYGSFLVEQEILKQDPAAGFLLQGSTDGGWFGTQDDN